MADQSQVSPRGGAPRWKSEELAKLKEIIHEHENMRVSGNGKIFWKMVSDKMKASGFDREVLAVSSKWHRHLRKSKSKSSSIYDVSDSDCFDQDSESSEEEFEVYLQEYQDAPQNGSKDDVSDSKPWVGGNTWSDQESDIAYQCIKSQRDKERELKLEPVTADQIWRMVAKALEAHNIYRKITNIHNYWRTKGREKYNLDERTPGTIERSSRARPRLRGGKTQQSLSERHSPSDSSHRSAAREDDISDSMIKSPTEDSFSQDNSNADSSTRNVRFLVSPSQHAALMVQYAKYNHMDNPVVQKLIEEYGLSREQIQSWYIKQRAIDSKEAELQKQAESQKLASPPIDKMELGGLDTKRRASDGGFQRETGEEPAKRVRYSLDSEGSMERQNGVQNEGLNYATMAPGLNVPLNNASTILSTIEVQNSSPKPEAESDIPDLDFQKVKDFLTANIQKAQQTILATEKKDKELRLAIIAHKEKADIELKAAMAKEQELTVQEDIRKKAKKFLEKIDLMGELDD